MQESSDTNATPSSKVDALTAKLTTLYYGDLSYTMPPAVLQQHYSVAIGYLCSQPSKGGSQWSSSTLLQTEVDLALE